MWEPDNDKAGEVSSGAYVADLQKSNRGLLRENVRNVGDYGQLWVVPKISAGRHAALAKAASLKRVCQWSDAAPLVCSVLLCVIDSLERVSQGQSLDGLSMPGHLRWHLAEHMPTQVETDPHVPLSTALVPPSKVRWTEGRGQLHPTVSGTLQGQH